MSSTDSRRYFPSCEVKKQGLKEQLRPMLELESGSNDPMAYMLTLLLIQIIQTPAGETNLWYSFLMFIVQMSVGAVSRFLTGKNGRMADEPVESSATNLYPILTVSLCILYLLYHRAGEGKWLPGRIHRGVGRRQSQDSAQEKRHHLLRWIHLAFPDRHVPYLRLTGQST